jgi:hypothetical protein
MKKGAILFLLSLTACIEKYDFNVIQNTGGLVIESFISNVSYTESLATPSDGHRFTVTLSKTSDVDNVRDVKVGGAHVFLLDNAGNRWDYTGTGQVLGNYILLNDTFKAEKDKKYQLNVDLKEGQHFESNWEGMPSVENKMGDFSIREMQKEEYVWESEEQVVRTLDGLKVDLKIPLKMGSETYHYQFSFEPIWMYTSSLAYVVNSQNIVCWVRSNLFLKDYVLLNDAKGGFDKELFYLRTKGNELMYQYFSTLVHQDVITDGYASFWKDLDAQKEKGGLYDQAPFGLTTNFRSTNSDWTVNGYFGVVNRISKRWTFNPQSLTYVIENNLEELCLLLNNEPGRKEGQCYYCNEYNLGVSTTAQPNWWANR